MVTSRKERSEGCAVGGGWCTTVSGTCQKYNRGANLSNGMVLVGLDAGTVEALGLPSLE